MKNIISMPATRQETCLTREAAKIIGCTMRHVRSLAANGTLASTKMGAPTTVFDMAAVVAYAKEKASGRKRGTTRGARPGGFQADPEKKT